ncbi:MAG: hypothetical protein JRI71_06370 [Deltaproteobacteria bacterium]|nr:hypothetical protein [Deltaproteobacteria bacterium]
MEERDTTEHKRRYDIFRHHAWAGTAFLSVLLALRYIIPVFLATCSSTFVHY